MIPWMEKHGIRKKDAVLTDENREESARLKKLYEEAKHGLSQADFGAAYGIGNQGAVWQCLNGKGMPISLKAARGFAKGLKCDIADFSPRLAAEAEKNLAFVAPAEWPFPMVSPAAVQHLTDEQRGFVQARILDAIRDLENLAADPQKPEYDAAEYRTTPEEREAFRANHIKPGGRDRGKKQA